MPSVEHSRAIAASFPVVWDFVRDMDNWAPLVTGYQKHEKHSDEVSTWFLKGELGGLTRVAEFKATVSEWDERGRVVFSLQGKNEPVTGTGEFIAVSRNAGEGPIAGRIEPSSSIIQRLKTLVARWVFDILFKGTEREREVTTASPGSGETEILFKLSLNAGGMTGPVMNMLIAPMLKPVAEELADRIAEAITTRQQNRA